MKIYRIFNFYIMFHAIPGNIVCIKFLLSFLNLSDHEETKSSKIRGQISAIRALSYHGNTKSSRFQGLVPAIQVLFGHGNAKTSQSRGLALDSQSLFHHIKTKHIK